MVQDRCRAKIFPCRPTDPQSRDDFSGSWVLAYENKFWQDGFQRIAGVDEAGRGPLAGPVVAAAVVFPPGMSETFGIRDSKQLSPSRRAELSCVIQQKALAFNISATEHFDIDALNILQATFKAMRCAVEGLSMAPDFILIDGNRSPHFGIPTQMIVKGDAISLSIAAASILAKVTRDGIMMQWHKIFPQYGFDHHKGYPTAEHLDAIQKY
ncbi:MAG: ribonuclease HII, partial [Calditrichaeota bacterium]